MLAFAEAGAVLVAGFGQALVAAYAFLEFRAVAVFGGKGAAAGVAQTVFALLQAMTQADALVKDETLTLPEALLGGDVLKVFQDAAFEVEHILDPLRDQVIR